VDAGLLERLLGGNRAWSGPCVVILDADARVQIPGTDSIISGGQKMYAPRVATGRIAADTVMLLPDERALVVVDRVWSKDHVGQTVVKQTMTVVNVDRVVGVEFDNIGPLKALGVQVPPAVRETEYRPGMMVG